MKQLLTLIFLVILSQNLIAQITVKKEVTLPKMQLKPNGFVGTDSTVNFIVIEMPGKKKSELYKSSLVYLNSIHSDPQKALSVVENESITINASTESIKGSIPSYLYKVNYKINIQFKDGKIRFEPSITDFTEGKSPTNVKRFYVASTDSPKEVELNCIWMISERDKQFFLFKTDLKSSFDNWINSYIAGLVTGIKKSDW